MQVAIASSARLASGSWAARDVIPAIQEAPLPGEAVVPVEAPLEACVVAALVAQALVGAIKGARPERAGAVLLVPAREQPGALWL